MGFWMLGKLLSRMRISLGCSGIGESSRKCVWCREKELGSPVLFSGGAGKKDGGRGMLGSGWLEVACTGVDAGRLAR